MQSTKQAIFHLGEEGYSLDIIDVVTIEKVTAIEPVSSLPQNFKGAINLRGDIIPVYSLRSKFGMEEIVPDQDTRFVITLTNGILVAYEVDKMAGIVEVSEAQFYNVPSIVQSSSTSYVKGITKTDGRLILILDKDKLLNEEENDKIKKAMKKDKTS